MNPHGTIIIIHAGSVQIMARYPVTTFIYRATGFFDMSMIADTAIDSIEPPSPFNTMLCKIKSNLNIARVCCVAEHFKLVTVGKKKQGTSLFK
jgi:hypothetical protein